jgi:hypothetical protein
MNDKQILCIKWGTAYGPSYVNRLYGMAARHISGHFRFFCLTDDEAGIRPEVICKPLPDLGTKRPDYAAHVWGKPERGQNFGVWDKVRLWNRDLSGIEGDVLFLDLDIVITDALDPFFDFESNGRVVMARSETRPFRKAGQSSVYRFRVGQLAPLWESFRDGAKAVVETWKMEQDYLHDRAPGGVAYWPRTWVRNYRVSCVPVLPLNYLQTPRPPKGCRVVIFPGRLNPPDALVGRWSEADTPRAPLAHLRAGFSGVRRENLWKHLCHYVQPAPWIAHAWQEGSQAPQGEPK